MLDDEAPVVISSQTLNRQDGRDEYHVRAAAMGSGRRPAQGRGLRGPGAGAAAALVRRQPDRARLPLRQLGDDAGRRRRPRDRDRQRLPRADISADEDTGKMVYRVAATARPADHGSPRRRPTTPPAGCRSASWSTAAGAPWTARAEQGVEPQFADQRRWLDAYWDRVRRRRRRAARRCSRPSAGTSSSWPRPPARAEQSGVPAKGVTGSGYGGHYFWDTEIYVLPFLTYTSPAMARSALRFRYNMLDAARRRAQDLAQSGALFPWRTINGEEASAYYAAGTAQYHIDADIAYALCKYVGASGDEDFMCAGGHRHPRRDRPDVGRPGLLARGRRRHGAASTSTASPGPDEYTTVVNDNLFTNVMARFNLDQAAGVVRHMAKTMPARYRRARRSGWSSTTDEVEEWAAAAQRDGHPVRPGSPASTRRTRTSWTGRCGTCGTPRRTSGRCCCTTTRW